MRYYLTVSTDGTIGVVMRMEREPFRMERYDWGRRRWIVDFDTLGGKLVKGDPSLESVTEERALEAIRERGRNVTG